MVEAGGVGPPRAIDSTQVIDYKLHVIPEIPPRQYTDSRIIHFTSQSYPPRLHHWLSF